MKTRYLKSILIFCMLGLASYGLSLDDNFRRVSVFVISTYTILMFFVCWSGFSSEVVDRYIEKTHRVYRLFSLSVTLVLIFSWVYFGLVFLPSVALFSLFMFHFGIMLNSQEVR